MPMLAQDINENERINVAWSIENHGPVIQDTLQEDMCISSADVSRLMFG